VGFNFASSSKLKQPEESDEPGLDKTASNVAINIEIFFRIIFEEIHMLKEMEQYCFGKKLPVPTSVAHAASRFLHLSSAGVS